MAQMSFNPQAHVPSAAFEVLKPDWYAATGVIESDVVQTAAGGQMVKITIALANGRKVFTNFNIVNENPKAVEIAYGDLTALCHAIGLTAQVTDSQQLHGRPFDVKLKIEKREGYDDRNVVASGGFAPAGSKASAPVHNQQPAQFQQGYVHQAQPVNNFGGVPAQAPQQFTPPAPVQQQVPTFQPQQQAPAHPFQGQAPQAPAAPQGGFPAQWAQR